MRTPSTRTWSFVVFAVSGIFCAGLCAGDRDQYSLWVTPGPGRTDAVRVTCCTPPDVGASRTILTVREYRDGRPIGSTEKRLELSATFTVPVRSTSTYELRATVFDGHGDVIGVSETITIRPGVFLAETRTVENFATAQSPRPALTLQAAGGQVSVDSMTVQCDTFPDINLFLQIQGLEEGDPLLTEDNFVVREDGHAPASGIVVIPPDESGGLRSADIVFIFDRSGSMCDDRDRLRDAMDTFLARLSSEDINYRLGVVSYLTNPTVYDDGALTEDLDYFRTILNSIGCTGGTENAFLAMDTALRLTQWRPGAQKVLVVITDEDDDFGGPTLAQINASLQSAQATAYAVVDTAFGHANQDFCAPGSITQTTGGRCYSIYSPDFTDFLDDIGFRTGAQYIVRYETSNRDTESGNRTVAATVEHDGTQIVAQTTYDPLHCNQIFITLTPETAALSATAQRLARPLEIVASIVSADPTRPITATLYFKRAADPSYSAMQMARQAGSDLFSATIPSSMVVDPYVNYYILVRDGDRTVSLPSVDPGDRPLAITVLPNVPPRIVHTPVSEAAAGTDVEIVATITDETNRVESAVLFYRKARTILYERIAFAAQGSTYIATIPGTDVSAPGVEYYVQAEDDYGAFATYGSADSPVLVAVADAPPGGQVCVELRKIKIWADQITGADPTCACPAVCQASGNVRIGTVAGDTHLLRTSSVLEIQADQNSIQSMGPGLLTALGIRRDPSQTPEDIPLWSGSFAIDATTGELSLGGDGQSQFRWIGNLLLEYSIWDGKQTKIVLRDDNTLTISNVARELNGFHVLCGISEIVLDPAGADSTGRIELRPEDLGVDKLSILGISFEDFELVFDFVRRSVTFGAAVELGTSARTKLPLTSQVLNFDSIDVSFDVLLDPLSIDGFQAQARLRDPTLDHPGVFSFPQSPPGPFGVAPTAFRGGVKNLSALYSGAAGEAHFVAGIDGAIVDQIYLEQLIKLAFKKWLLSGELSADIALKWGIDWTFSGELELLERFPLAAAQVRIANPAEFSGEINVADALRASTRWRASKTNRFISLSGQADGSLEIPPAVPFVGGTQLSEQEFSFWGFLSLQPQPEVQNCEFTTTFPLFFVTFVIKVDLLNAPYVFVSRKKELAHPKSPSFVRVVGFHTITSVKRAPGESRRGAKAVTEALVIPSGHEVVLFAVRSDEGTPVLEVQDPDGTVYTPEAYPADEGSPSVEIAFYKANEDAHEGFFALKDPQGGSYSVTIRNDTEIGAYELSALLDNQPPSLTLTQPEGDVAAAPGNVVPIAWEASDLDDDARVSLYYDTDGSGDDGALIEAELSEDAVASFAWTVPEGIHGPIRVYGVIDDGHHVPSSSYAPGRVLFEDLTRPPAPEGLQASPFDGGLELWWDLNDPADGVESYEVHLQDGGQVFSYAILSPPFTADNLANGKTYRVWVTAFDQVGAESAPSVALDVTPEGFSADGPPDLRIESAAMVSASGNIAEIEVVVGNVGEFDAYAYTIRGYAGGFSDADEVFAQSFGLLAAGAEETASFSWDISVVDPAHADTLYLRITDVVLRELDTANNSKLVTLPRYTLDVQVLPEIGGTVLGAGVSCGPECREDYLQSLEVALEAVTEPGFALSSWEGADTVSDASCTVLMDADRSVTARFDLLPPGDFACTGGPLRAELSWTNLREYDAVRIVRDGVQVATVEDGANSYTDDSVDAWGTYQYEIYAVIGETTSAAASCEALALEREFVRGELNNDGTVDTSDAIVLLGYLYTGQTPELECHDAGDADGDGTLYLTDAVLLLYYDFFGTTPPGAPPAAPFPDCGSMDPPGSGLGCENFPGCGETPEP